MGNPPTILTSKETERILNAIRYPKGYCTKEIVMANVLFCIIGIVMAGIIAITGNSNKAKDNGYVEDANQKGAAHVETPDDFDIQRN